MTDDGAELADAITRIDQLESRMDDTANLVTEMSAQIEDLEKENEDIRRENGELRRQLEDVQDGTDLLQQVKKSAAQPKDKKVAIVLLTLRTDVKHRDGPATMTAKECWEALNRKPDRTTMYGLMQDAADAVDGDVVTYIKEDRSAKRNTRLKMDPGKGPLPSVYEGHNLTAEAEA